MNASSFYRGSSGEDYQRSVHGDALESPRVFKAKSILARHRYFKGVSHEARVLEFGVGIGTNLALLHNEVREGYDIGEFAREMSRKHGIKVYDKIEEIPVGAYDLVLCRHVLEHVPNPADVLTKLGAYTSSTGLVLIILPVERTNRPIPSLPEPDVNNHLYAWGPQQIVNLIHAVGMRPLRHRYFWYSMQARLSLLSANPKLYSALVSLAGMARRQKELAIWAEVRD